jgi:hypothetical protein
MWRNQFEEKKMNSLEGKVAAIAERLAADGASVAINYVSRQNGSRR